MKIPDNTAYSALQTLRRLGVEIQALERADIWQFDDLESGERIAERVRRTQTLFNPNKHSVEVRATHKPQAGEAWIEELTPAAGAGSGKHYVAWRLFEENGKAAETETVKRAVEKLLCNPAIERAILHE
ncbi:MAG TPA: hypothetical protein VGR69_08955 [Candidatus Rubrimentiphilum sp.]|nr:hypothetical protein [Candidatus Rubrimentiphilum sp.]